MIDALFLVAGTAILLWLSRKPLRNPGGHGFYRFFAWEGILGLLVLNRDTWGRQPFSPHQMTSWVLMLLSIYLVVQGIRLLRRQGAPSQQREEHEGLYDFEKTTALVTTGIFKYIRHPMYASLLALTWGAFCQKPSLLGATIALLASFFLALTAKADEKECAAYFGDEYLAYKQRTKMFIPFVL